MRQAFDLNIASLDKFTMLVHGLPGAGKTHLMGDMLRHESANGPVRFINVAGEDGTNSIANLGLGPIAETVEDMADFSAVAAEYRGLKLRAVAIDSLQKLASLVMKSKVGDRLPRTGDAKTNEWGEVHWAAENMFNSLHGLANIVLVACSSDKYTNDVTGQTSINPELPGKQSRFVTSCFDFVAYLETRVLGPDRVERVLKLAPNAAVTVRQRLPKQITTDIVIPTGGGGWANFVKALDGAMQGGKK